MRPSNTLEFGSAGIIASKHIYNKTIHKIRKTVTGLSLLIPNKDIFAHRNGTQAFEYEFYDDDLRVNTETTF